MPIELTIEKLIYGGDGLARLQGPDGGTAQPGGKSVFVPYVLAGERVSAEVTEEKRSFARAEVLDLLMPSPDRVAPTCPYFGPCGGCHYQHASYEAQLSLKRDILLESLKRNGGITLPVPLNVLASPEPFGYRNRTRLHVHHHPQFQIGYYRAGTHDLLSIEHCPISSPLINRALQAFWTAGNHGDVPASIQEIEIFAEDQDAECLLELYVGGRRPSDGELERFAGSIQGLLPECVGIHAFTQSQIARSSLPVLQQIASAGDTALDYHAGGHTYKVSAGSFFQVNRHLLDPFVELVTDGAHGRRALDLYAGAGLFAVPLAEKFAEVVAVEASPLSFGDLTTNLHDPAKRYCQTTEKFLKHRGRDIRDTDLAVIDPPRAGIGVECAKLLVAAEPAEIRYISCDPTTLARDLKVLLESGYRIDEAYMVDMFPQTLHIESFVRLHSRRHE